MDQNFKAIALIDAFESFIWTDRYNAFGDFELYSVLNSEILQTVQQDYYLRSPWSDRLMIIDERAIVSDVESGDNLVIRGRSLESILDRRVIWPQTILTGNFQSEMQRLLDENIINPSTEERKISNFIFQPSTDPAISNLTVNSQFTGDTLYDAVTALCELNNLGWKIVLNSNDQFVFSFYMGANRSYSQIANPYVVFSPGFENIINSNYLETSRILKTFTIVAGEGEGVDRKAAFLSRGEEGLARRELFVDARDISSNTENGEISYVGYIALLAQRGSQRMTEHGFIKTFDGEIDHSQMFIYGQDFLLGDVVQIVNEFGIEASTRLVEIIFSSNNEGDKIIPTFNVVS